MVEKKTVDDLVRDTTDAVFVEQREGIRAYFNQFERKDGTYKDHLLVNDAVKMQKVFYENVLSNNQVMFDNLVNSSTYSVGFPSDVVAGFIRHRTECQVFDLYKKGNGGL